MQVGRRRLFIYYRVAERELGAVGFAVQHAQRALCERHPGLSSELLYAPKPNAAGERTMMETYARNAQVSASGIDAPLQAAIEAELCEVLRPWLHAGMRHVEVFEEAPCAS